VLASCVAGCRCLCVKIKVGRRRGAKRVELELDPGLYIGLGLITLLQRRAHFSTRQTLELTAADLRHGVSRHISTLGIGGRFVDSVVEDAGRRNPSPVDVGGDRYLSADCGVEQWGYLWKLVSNLAAQGLRCRIGGSRVWLGWWFGADIRLRGISPLARLSWGSL
jgi:hypothetical protein